MQFHVELHEICQINVIAWFVPSPTTKHDQSSISMDGTLISKNILRELIEFSRIRSNISYNSDRVEAERHLHAHRGNFMDNC